MKHNEIKTLYTDSYLPNIAESIPWDAIHNVWLSKPNGIYSGMNINTCF